MSKSIVCFGEALIDFLNTGKQQQGQQQLNQFVQFPGGAPANVAVAAAKLGSDVRFVGQVGRDPFGDFLIESLSEYGVMTDFTLQHATAKTSLAFVMLDKDGDRSFSFYRDNTADVVMTPSQLESNMFSNCGVFHFCSNTLVEDGISHTTLSALSMAKVEQAVISFDVNLRHNLWSEHVANVKHVNQFVEYADVVKFSRDEFEYLCEGYPQDYMGQCFKAGVQLILITDGGNAVEVMTNKASFTLEIPTTQVVDTTAGGDGFSGGMLYGLNKYGFDAVVGNVDLLKQVVTFAIDCGAYAVARPGAFPSLPTLSEIDSSRRI